MATRRFVFDPVRDRIVEVDAIGRTALGPSERYAEALDRFRRNTSDESGQVLREAALERASRREFAHRRFLDERRWTET